MSAFIKLNRQDAYIQPYTAYKRWTVFSSSFGAYGIEVYTATSQSTEVLFDPISNPRSGANAANYDSLVYRSIKHLYYSGITGSAAPSSSYESYNQTTLEPSSSRELGQKAFVVSVPQELFGSALKPGTFTLGTDEPIQAYVSGAFINTGYFRTAFLNGYNIYDNGEGVLIESGSRRKVGDIIYPHGMAIVTDATAVDVINGLLSPRCSPGPALPTGPSYITGSYWPTDYTVTDGYSEGVDYSAYGVYYSGSDCYLVDEYDYLQLDSVSGSYLKWECPPPMVCQPPIGFDVNWQSTYQVYTHNYRCKIKDSELTYSHNSSIKSGSNGDMLDFATGSYFQPYVTTVGLYNDAEELIAIGKLAQPVPKSKDVDTTFVVKFDI